MAVRLTIPYGPFATGSVVDFDNATEASLVAQARAVYVFTEGTTFEPLTATQQAVLATQVPVAVRVPNITANDINEADANTAALQAFADSLAVISLSRVEVVLPDGLVYVNAPIVWRVHVNQSQATSTTPNPERVWPRIKSAGRTGIVYTGSQFNGGTWKLENASASGGENTHLVIEDIYFVGPGQSVYSTAVATSNVGAAATSVAVSTGTGAQFVVGDAIAIHPNDPGTSPNGATFDYSRPPWWATVTAVSGDTVSFLPATCADFAANVGNRVVRWKQHRALEIGGTRTQQDVFFYVELRRCGFIDFFAGLATNDITTLVLEGQCVFSGCVFGVEEGYNADSHRFVQPNFIYQVLSRSGTVTSGQRTITGLSGTSDLKVGSVMNDYTAPGTATAFPPWAVIESIDSASQVTMTHAATLGAPTSRTFQPEMGTGLAIGPGHSPWYPRSSASYDGRRDNANCIRIVNPTINHFQRLYACYGDSNSAIIVEDFYSELNQQFALLGHIYGLSAKGPYVFDGGVFSGPEPFSRPVVECIGGGANVVFRNIEAASGLAMPLYASLNSDSTSSIKLEKVNVSTTGIGLLWPDQFLFQGLTPPAGVTADIYAGGASPTGMVSARGSVSSSFAVETNFFDGVTLNLTGSLSINNQTYGSPVLGRRFRVVATSGGAHTLTMGTNYKTQAGAAIGAIAVSASGRVCVMDFLGTGTAFVLVGGTISSGVPVFVTLS